MASKTANSITSIPLAAVPPSVFSGQEWAELAKMLVSQDAIVLPGTAQALTHEDSDSKAEQGHRKASALALAQHWASMGFALTKQDTISLCGQDATIHAWLHKHITPALRERLGGHVRMTPMYPNFPKQVMGMDEAELLFNALLHYMGDMFDMRLVPDTEEKKRKPLSKKEGQVRPLRLVDMAGLRQTLDDLTSMNTVWTPAQVSLAKHALPLMLHWSLVGVDTALPQRENQAHLMGAWLGLVANGRGDASAWPADRVSTTDVLRAAVAYSGGDPSLASTSEKVRFARMSRKQRRVIMSALERAVVETSNPVSDLHTYRQGWLRLAEQLHVGEWKAMPKSQDAINALRNQPEPISWNGHLDAVMANASSKKTLAQALALFPQNPGLAARALKRILLWAEGDQEQVISAFGAVAERVDTPVLLAVEATFLAEIEKPNRARVMLPKGSAAWRYRVDANERSVPAAACLQVSKACETALTARFSALAPLGKVFVEKGLDQVIVPKGLRSASESVGVVARGSWLPVGEDAKIVRLFLWWKDTDGGRVDVDLSAVGVSDTFQNTETCNYHALKEQGMTHSGDLTSAPNGAAEFVDLRLDKLDKKTRYIVLTANVFHGPGFSQLPECFVGWQERESGKGQRGEIMEMKTVVDKFQVSCSAKGFLGVVFDVRERRLMWLDLPLQTRGHESIHGSSGNVRTAVEDFQLYAFSQPKMVRLVELHVNARGGELVHDIKDANVIFSLTPKLAKEGQQVIAATQPQAVASALLAGPKRKEEAGAAVATAQITDAPGMRVEVNLKARAGSKPKR